jgi:hypothetical protein
VIEPTLHPTPRWRDVVLEQIRIVGLSFRREALVVAAILGIVTVVIAIDIVNGTAETWFDSGEWFPIGIAAFLYPFAIWRRDRPFAPAFLWTLPVERRRLALAKVFAGFVWLMAALTAFASWQLTLAFFSGVADAETFPFIASTGVTAMYLFGSALILGLRHPLRWLLGTLGVLFLLGFFNEATHVGAGPDRIDTFLTSSGLGSTINNTVANWGSLPDAAQWAIATFLSVGAGLTALWAALSRHRERRK